MLFAINIESMVIDRNKPCEIPGFSHGHLGSGAKYLIFLENTAVSYRKTWYLS